MPSTPTPPAPAPALPPAAVEATIDWYDEAARDLPWRHGGVSAWAILVSEVMLQQTPVARVLPRWQEWMRRWPEPADLAAAPTADVLRAWDRLGYPRRALRLQGCARAIVEHHGGQVPLGEDALRALPGIGEYTAAAVTAFAHHGRAVVADVNIRRVLVRSVLGEAHPGAAYTATQRAVAARTLPADEGTSVRWNQAVMELGALVCTARSPRCEACPLREEHCRWYADGRPDGTSAPGRRQAFEGTDRQMRGKIMALLREGPAAPGQIAALDPEDPARTARCLASLIADGLAVEERTDAPGEASQEQASGARGGDPQERTLAVDSTLPFPGTIIRLP